MTYRIYQIGQGVPVEAVSSVQLLSVGVEGTLGALRRLVHPDGDVFPPLTYYTNPIRTFNFATDTLRHPIVNVSRTLSSTKVIRFEEVVEDVVVTEVWEPIGGLSMPFFMLAYLYEYLNNPPALDIANPQYIIWEPRDETTDTYKVELIGVQVGGGSPGKFNMRQYRARGGPNGVSGLGTIDTPTDTMDVVPSTLLDQPVSVTMRIVEKVAV